jgi:hypothetical protein
MAALPPAPNQPNPPGLVRRVQIDTGEVSWRCAPRFPTKQWYYDEIRAVVLLVSRGSFMLIEYHKAVVLLIQGGS